MVDIAIVRSDDGSTDVRVAKLCESLSKKYDVLLLGWDRDDKFPRLEHMGRHLNVCRFKMRLKPIPINRAYRRVVPTIIFAFWVLRKLMLVRPRITYACDEDVALPCFTYKSITRAPFIFDVFDRFSFEITDGAIHIMLRFVEEFFASKADLLITNSMSLLRSFVHRPANSEIIMNCPDDKKAVQESGTHRTSPLFKIVYAGYIIPKRGLEAVIEAISALENVQLVIAGRPHSYEYLQTLTSQKNVVYLGIFPFEEAIRLQSSADVIVIPYDPNVLMNRIGMPNKLFDAMMLGKPLISTVAREIIEETSCGIFVEFDPVSIRSAIAYLRGNPPVRQRLGKNGRIAFEKKYNWSLMEEKLLTALGRVFRIAHNDRLRVRRKRM